MSVFSRHQPPPDDRLKKLANKLETLANRDSQRIEHERRIFALRREAAVDLHRVCVSFVAEMNRLLNAVSLDVTPETFTEDTYTDARVNLIQIHVSGRVIQFAFQATAHLEAREALRSTAYTLEGTVRWFNQDLLDRDDINEHRLYYCLDKARNEWRYLDPRSQRLGTVDNQYVAGLFEQLV
jgi:hypothetical protein